MKNKGLLMLVEAITHPRVSRLNRGTGKGIANAQMKSAGNIPAGHVSTLFETGGIQAVISDPKY